MNFQLDKKIVRRYTTELEKNPKKTVYDLFKWKKVDVLLKNYATGAVMTDMKDLEFPEGYSQSAADIIGSRYFRKTGAGERGQEYSMRQVAHRMVKFWVDSLIDEGMINDEQGIIVYDELVYMFLAQMWAPNSPQWFNTGLKYYGIDGPPQGHYYFTEEGGLAESKDAYTRTQGSACFIISIKDTLVGEKSLTDQLKTESLLFKFGSGSGTNWSCIRAKDEVLSGGGKSSGLLSFLKVSDKNAGAIKSGGTTRRAAKMNILNMDHPEIRDYIKWKSTEEDKVEALMKMGYNASIDGEAYETVSGQNANNSVRIPDKFMQALDNKSALWRTVNRVDGKIYEKIRVADLWDDVANAAWRCGDPGVQYDDTINAWHTCPAGEDGELSANNRINASNPCSEYMFLDDTACNLASMNVIKFYDFKENSFDIDSFIYCAEMIQLALEATIHGGQFPTKDIARRSYLFRTTGLGLTNLGTLFMQIGAPYDSDEARNVAAALSSAMTGASYYASAMMAEKISPFKYYELNRAHMLKVIENHARAAGCGKGRFEDMPYDPVTIDHGVLSQAGFQNISKALKTIWDDCREAGKKSGFRNAQVSVLAPTGTIAFAMDCATTSSEPFFSHVAYKKLVGGGYMEIVNPAIPDGLRRLGYSEDEINDITAYVLRKEDGMLADGKIEGAPHLKEEHYAVFDTANKCGTGARFISPEGHVKMMGALTPHITGAVSKTVNLPNEATPEDVKNIYYLSWKLGVKAIALYRDGCKVCQPMNTVKDSKKETALTDLTYKQLIEIIENKKTEFKPMRVKLSGIRTAHVHEAAINGMKLYITTSFYEDGKLGEIYISSGRQGSLTKGLLDSMSTTISEMMQYGVPPEDIARMYRGHTYEPNGFVTGHPFIKHVDSISDLISKIIDIELGNYSYCQVKPDGYVDTEIFSQGSVINKHYSAADYIQGESCSVCKSPKLVKNGTCKVCTECGTTTGCS